jgi:hypothetical protein
MAKEKFEFYVAGVQHHQLSHVLNELNETDELILEPEPTNKYDKNAVKIKYDSGLESKTIMLGYVPGRLSADVKHFLSRAREPICEVTRLSPDSKPWNQLMVKIYDDGDL